VSPRVISGDDDTRWDAWLRQVDGANARQTSHYRKALSLFGHTAELLVLDEGSSYAAGALLGIKPIGILGAPLVHASGGLALADPGDSDRLRQLLEAVTARCSALRASRLEISLRVPRAVGDVLNPSAAALEGVLRECGFEPVRALETYYVALAQPSDEALLESFGKNPRRHIRKAVRDGLVVETSTDPADFAAFGEAHRVMCGRKGLDPFPGGFPEKVLLPLVHDGHAELFVARFRGVARNYLLAGCTAEPIYLWGALHESARDPECPQTGQALHYTAMCRFRAMGKKFYDFGGTPGPVPDPAHPNFSVWKFKHEFGVLHVPFLGVWKSDLRPASAAMLDAARAVVTLGRRLARR